MILPQIILPWPMVALWPNRKAHWRLVYGAREIQKEETRLLCMEAGLHRLNVPVTSLMVSYTFCAPSQRRYDRDGALQAMKGATDSIAAAIRVDDSNFDFTLRRGDPSKNGGVIVNIEVLG
ncbi:hypothetical protein [Paracoccus shanxieyensis]|uniref:Uncharacterized protein n=1 Tax=Paracoccus shanxieyensis TaxID=2675752 RepID=A0A6L6J5S2_9RHOB|nr:hypothetical protein [Paracoccus shanxieyensis]MTH66722.1 hypothetical protein [Paracoccus shanxieyensis]MTH89953.1 hypothetical protein [Paracoccus shanxieyensis]